jgi:hypothetical protein
MRALDGNAMAGLLADAVGADLSGLASSCADCGATGAVGAQRAWITEIGAVLRCHACDAVLVVVARGRLHVERLGWLAAPPA